MMAQARLRNASWMPSRTSTAFTESAVNQIISKRMARKQQMRWTPRGAHLLLQVRTRVLYDQLAGDFHRWYPGFNQAPDPWRSRRTLAHFCPALQNHEKRRRHDQDHPLRMCG